MPRKARDPAPEAASETRSAQSRKPRAPAAAERAPDDRYGLRLYVTGMTPRSQQAVAAIRRICEEYLEGRFDLEVVDLYEHPGAAREADIIATPTLVKRLPLPLRKLVGDLSRQERVLVVLDVPADKERARRPKAAEPQ